MGEVLGRQPHAGARVYYGKDRLGSVRAAVIANGSVVEARDYDAWGAWRGGRS